MNYEKRLILKTLIKISLYSIAIMIPALVATNNTYLFQILSIIFVVFISVWIEYNSTTKLLTNFMSSFGVEISDSTKVSYLINRVGEVFKESKHSNVIQKKMNYALELSIEINNLFLKTNDQQSVYDFILLKALDAIGKTDKGSIMLLNKDDELRPISLIGFDHEFKELRIKKENDFLYKSTSGRVDRSVIIEDVVEFNRNAMTVNEFEEFYSQYPKKFQTVLSTPIKVDNDFIGVINIDAHKKDVFDEEDIFIMDLFASQLEVAIRNRNLLDEILFLSRYDSLTGLYNRKYFDDSLANLIKKESEFVYVLIDINDLKKVNDGYGHSEGDRLLKVFAEVVGQTIRQSDYFARLGGDEFAIILSELSKMEASKIFLRMMKELQTYTKSEEMPYQILFSYGMTVFPLEAQSAEELYLLSDQKMYNMKRNHKKNKASN
jgi:diguanylate cyclase (GGDEF)-like protein